MTAPSTRLQSLQQAVDAFVQARDWKKFHSPKNLVMALGSESAELLDLFDDLPDEYSRMIANDEKSLTKVKKETGDTLAFLMMFCNAAQLQPKVGHILSLKFIDSPQNYAIRINSCVGKLLDIYRWKTEAESYDTAKAGKAPHWVEETLREIFALGSALDFDPIEATYAKLAEVDKRYPVQEVFGKVPQQAGR